MRNAFGNQCQHHRPSPLLLICVALILQPAMAKPASRCVPPLLSSIVDRIPLEFAYLKANVAQIATMLSEAVRDISGRVGERSKAIRSEIGHGPARCVVWADVVHNAADLVTDAYFYHKCAMCAEVATLVDVKAYLSGMKRLAHNARTYCLLMAGFDCETIGHDLQRSLDRIHNAVTAKVAYIQHAAATCLRKRLQCALAEINSRQTQWRNCVHSDHFAATTTTGNPLSFHEAQAVKYRPLCCYDGSEKVNGSSLTTISPEECRNEPGG